MTKKERIEQLEREVEMLRARLAARPSPWGHTIISGGAGAGPYIIDAGPMAGVYSVLPDEYGIAFAGSAS